MQKQQLERLLFQADTMTQQLAQIKQQIANNTVSFKMESPSLVIVKAINHREVLRTLAQALEANRSLVQLKKQRIQKSRIVKEGLESYKRTLKQQIVAFNTNVQSVDEYFQSPLEPIDWQNNYEEGQKRINESLQKLRAKDQSYKSKISKKNDLIKKINEKTKLYGTVMVKEVKKLNEQALEVGKIFAIQANETLEKIQNQQLAYIYDTFKVLKIVEKIDVSYTKQNHQIIDLVVKPTKLELYQFALKYNIKLQQKQLKIKICYPSPQFCKLVIGVDRRSDYSTRDIFHRLIDREDAKPVFEEPSNQLQRNFNSKYIFVQWIEDVLCSSSVKSSKFIMAVRNRAFIVSLTKYIFQNMKNMTWISLLNPIMSSQIASKRFLIEQSSKISFNEYKQTVAIPPVVKKSINSYEQAIKTQIQPNRNRNALMQLLSKYGLEEIMAGQIYQYFKLCISYKGLRVQAFIILPYQYPQINLKIKVISLQMKQLQQVNLPSGIQCLARADSKSNNSQQIEVIERLINNSCIMNQEGNQPFMLLKCLNQLFLSVYNLYGEIKKGPK